MDNNGKFDLQCYFMYRYDRKKTEIYKKMKASYITLTENCTYFNLTKKITFLTFGQKNLPNFK